MKRTGEEVIKILHENRKAIKGYGVLKLGLFGSVARGEDSGAGDLDFLVEFENKSFDAYMDLKAFLEDLFGCRVDLVLASSIKPRLRERILGEAIYAEGF